MICKSEGPGSVSTQWIYAVRNQAGCSLHNSASGYSVTSQDYRETCGVDTPHYFKLLRDGSLLPFTPFEQYTVNGRLLSWVWDFHVPSYPCSGVNATYTSDRDMFGCTISKQELLDKVEDYPVDYLVQAAAANIYSRWDVLTFAAEIEKTVALFRGTISRLLDLLKRGRLDQAWLESRYGWRLTYFDLVDITNAIRGLSNHRERHKQRVGASIGFVDSYTKEVHFTNADAYASFVDSWNISLRGSIVADIALSAIQVNPLVTAWELAKFSFIVDWVINIGRALEALSFVAFNTGYSAGKGWYITLTRQASPISANGKGGWTNLGFDYTALYTASLAKRVPTTVSVIPLISPNLNWTKVGDLVALLIQGFLRR